MFNTKRKIPLRKIIQVCTALPITLIALQYIPASATIFLILTVLGGAFYCGYFCPFGLLQEIGGYIGKKLKIKKILLPKRLDRMLKGLRYILFGFTSLYMVAFIFTIIKFDARSNLYLLLTGGPIQFTMLLSILVFFLLSIFTNKPFCKYFCIQGAQYGLASTVRLASIIRDEQACIDCKRCDKACSLDISVSTCHQSVKSLNCINCFECIKACPKANVLRYGMVPKKEAIFKSSLIAGFLIFFFVTQYAIPAASDDTNSAMIEVEETIEPSLETQTLITEEDLNQTEIIETEITETIEGAIEPTTVQNSEAEPSSEPESEIDEVINTEPIQEEPTITQPTTSTAPVVEPTTAEPTTTEPIVTGPIVQQLEGSGQGYKGKITIEVTLTDNQITAIRTVKHVDDKNWYELAQSMLFSQILEKQSADVDIISGATPTSKGIIAAIKEALSKAK